MSRNLVGTWVQKFEAGALNEDIVAADRVRPCKARKVALERLDGKQALKLGAAEKWLYIGAFQRPLSSPSQTLEAMAISAGA